MSVHSGWTLQSERRSELCVSECSVAEALKYVEQEAAAWNLASSSAVATRALLLVLRATGGACIILAPDPELRKLAPHAHVSDGGGMTQRLKNVHVETEEFEQLFVEFTAHTATDRWPTDHPDPLLRGQPKDGVGVLLSPSGYRVKCAVRLEGLPQPSKTWSCMGMRHNTALAAADLMAHAVVLVRSESGMVHMLVKGAGPLRTYCVGEESAVSPVAEVDFAFDAASDLTQFEVLHDTGFDEVAQQSGRLVAARQELEDRLAELQILSKDGPSLDVAGALHDLGVLCREGGDLPTARQHLEGSLRMKQGLLGRAPSAEVATGLHELGLVYKEMFYLRMAQRYLQQALDMRRALCPEEDGGEAAGATEVAEAALRATLLELSAVCVERRRLRSAQRHLEASLQTRRTAHAGGDERDSDMSQTLRALGVLEMKTGNFHAARQHLSEALHIERGLHGSTAHPDVARTLYSLGRLMLRSGNHAAARGYLEESMDISLAIHGDKPHQDVQRTLRLLAALDVRDGNFSRWRDQSGKSVRMHKAIHNKTSRLSALPAKLDRLGLFIVECVKSQCATADARGADVRKAARAPTAERSLKRPSFLSEVSTEANDDCEFFTPDGGRVGMLRSLGTPDGGHLGLLASFASPDSSRIGMLNSFKGGA